MASIFVSYARDDGADIAKELADELRAHKHAVFRDIQALPGGADWKKELVSAVKRSNILLILITPKSNVSKWVYKEFFQAQSHKKYILPIQVDNAPIPPYLDELHAVALERTNLKADINKVILAVQEIKLKSHIPFRLISVLASIAVLLVITFVAGRALAVREFEIPKQSEFVSSPQATAQACSLISTRNHLPMVGSEGTAVITGIPNCMSNLFPNTRINITGLYSEALEHEALWILVYTNGNYWPQSLDACRAQVPSIVDKSGGVWLSTFSLGASATQYDIVLATTKPGGQADKTFLDWYQTSCSSKQYIGFGANQIPEGLIELDSITVKSR
jgi:hypothetical protein